MNKVEFGGSDGAVKIDGLIQNRDCTVHKRDEYKSFDMHLDREEQGIFQNSVQVFSAMVESIQTRFAQIRIVFKFSQPWLNQFRHASRNSINSRTEGMAWREGRLFRECCLQR